MNAAAVRTLGAVAVALTVASAAAPARAGDDGQASLITGIATTFGLTKQDDPQIDYRERGRIVVPPKKVLPPPASARTDAAWPVNVETVRDKARKATEDAEPSARDFNSRTYLLVKPGEDVKVTSSNMDRAGPSCRVPDPKTGECPEGPHTSIDWNPLAWVGLQKKPKAELGPEPERQNLVDPPKGYRAPAEGVGAKVDQ